MRFLLFLTAFSVIYGWMHAYVFWKAEKTFQLSRSRRMGVGILFFFMIFCPWISRFFEDRLPELIVQSLARVGYPMDAGLLNLSGNRFLYVSRGSGTWGLPCGFWSHPR